MTALLRTPVAIVVEQHVSDAAMLRQTRTFLVRSPHVKLHQLGWSDERLAANLDGISLAGAYGRRLCVSALENAVRGSVFALSVGAIEQHDTACIEKLIALAQADTEARIGLVSALGWVSATSLRGVVKEFLVSSDCFQQFIGLVACGMHRVDPGVVLEHAMANPRLQLDAIILAGKLGRVDLLPLCQAGLAGEGIREQFESARALMLLGERQKSIEKLEGLALASNPYRIAALQTVLKVVDGEQTRRILESLSQVESSIRVLIRAIGVAGDPRYMSWIIQQMSIPGLSRLAGESFSTVTGIDLAYTDLDMKPPRSRDFGPDENPDNDNVAMGEDDGLPWPDPEKVAAWWQVNGPRFVAGNRYFMGASPSPLHCTGILRSGFQRQRIAAAEYLKLMRPDKSLFNTAAPARRQQRWISELR